METNIIIRNYQTHNNIDVIIPDKTFIPGKIMHLYDKNNNSAKYLIKDIIVQVKKSNGEINRIDTIILVLYIL